LIRTLLHAVEWPWSTGIIRLVRVQTPALRGMYVSQPINHFSGFIFRQPLFSFAHVFFQYAVCLCPQNCTVAPKFLMADQMLFLTVMAEMLCH